MTDLYRGGAFGLPWNAGKGAIEAKYPGGKWDEDDKGHARYCVASKQTLLKLPPPHQTKELCMLIGTDNTLASVTAVMEPSLQSLLAVVNRCRTTFGDFDAVVRDEAAIQSRSNGMLWTGDAPYVVRIESQNNEVGSPTRVTFTSPTRRTSIRKARRRSRADRARRASQPEALSVSAGGSPWPVAGASSVGTSENERRSSHSTSGRNVSRSSCSNAPFISCRPMPVSAERT